MLNKLAILSLFLAVFALGRGAPLHRRENSPICSATDIDCVESAVNCAIGQFFEDFYAQSPSEAFAFLTNCKPTAHEEIYNANLPRLYAAAKAYSARLQGIDSPPAELTETISIVSMLLANLNATVEGYCECEGVSCHQDFEIGNEVNSYIHDPSVFSYCLVQKLQNYLHEMNEYLPYANPCELACFKGNLSAQREASLEALNPSFDCLLQVANFCEVEKSSAFTTNTSRPDKLATLVELSTSMPSVFPAISEKFQDTVLPILSSLVGDSEGEPVLIPGLNSSIPSCTDSTLLDNFCLILAFTTSYHGLVQSEIAYHMTDCGASR